METKIQSLHFDADKKLLEYIEEKLKKLVHYSDDIIGTEVILKLDKSSHSDNKVVEIIINIPGNDLFSKRQCHTFEEAVDETVAALKTQVIKHKEKVKGL